MEGAFERVEFQFFYLIRLLITIIDRKANCAFCTTLANISYDCFHCAEQTPGSRPRAIGRQYQLRLTMQHEPLPLECTGYLLLA
jgi:hypothetical protein